MKSSHLRNIERNDMPTDEQLEVVRRAIEWIKANVEPRPTSSAEALYDQMESQCDTLAVIYVPFDVSNRGHFVDRGQILDYAITCGPGRVLDFGPGEGWPSLLMAPMVDEVVGVDGSKRRVEACTRNAKRMGLGNTSFVHVPPGAPLPFDDESFDGVTAGSSIEQTPDAKATLRELCRVLKPGGRLRMHYESLSYYAGGQERELHVGSAGDLMVYDRHLEEEYVKHLNLTFDLPEAEVLAVFLRHGVEPPNATSEVLADLKPHMTDAVTWTTRHPSCRTLLRWLPEVGFSSAQATYDGGWFARRLFDRLPEAKRPHEMSAVDEMLRPLVDVVVTMERPPIAPPSEWEPWVTAVR
jgi:SAM-dependent methyltransferase